MLKRIFLAVVLCAAALGHASAAERIVRFISDVDVQRNGDLMVTESIQVQSEYSQIRHGIFRDFPTTYPRNDGSRVEVGFDVLEVTREGRTENYVIERLSNGVRVRIGDASTTLNHGLHNYVIKYRTTRQIGFFDNFDELYWNATGTGWNFPIDFAEARITLPEKVEFKQTALYTGPQGARDKDARIVEQTSGHIVFRTTKGLPVHNGLTVAAGWQKGVIAPPTQAQKLDALTQDNPGIQYAALGGAGIILFYFVAWLLVGRDPPRGTIIPLFAPPPGMSAAAVRYVETMTFDNRVFTAAIVGLGVNGYLKLTGAGREGELHRANGTKPLDDAEQAVAKELFAKKSEVRLDQSDHETVNNAKLKLWRVLSADYKGKMFNSNLGWSFFGFFATAAVTAAIAYAFLQNYGDNGPVMLAGMLVPMLPVMIAASLIRDGWQRGEKGMMRLLIGLLVAGVAMAIGILILANTAGLRLSIAPGIAPYFLAAVTALGFTWLKAPSQTGRQVMDQIDGFKQYLGVAEEDRLNFLNPPEKTPELFEKFLPYAIALDVENAWAKRFAAVLAAAAAAGTATAVGSWYSGDSRYRSDPVAFAEHLGDDLSSTIAAASSSPASSGGSGGSSGSSGGGSSGGGGGGGGGGGW